MSTIDLTLPADDPTVRGWYQVVSHGFHGRELTDESLRQCREDAVADGQVLVAHYGSAAFSDPARPAATLSATTRTINIGRTLLDADLISDVTVRPSDAGRGLMRTMITDELTRAAGLGLPVVALTASDARLYGRFGFGISTLATTLTLSASATRPLLPPPHGEVEQVTVSELAPLRRVVFSSFHDATPGSVSRLSSYERWLDGIYDLENQNVPDDLRAAVHVGRDGDLDGYVIYRMTGDWADKTVSVVDLAALTDDARWGLWNFLASIKLATAVTYARAAADDPLRWALADPRLLRTDGLRDMLWTRVIDPIRVLEARRYAGEGTLTVTVDDQFGYADGTFHIEVASGEATVTRVNGGGADLELDAATLASLSLGGTRVRPLAAAGRIRGGGITAAAALLDTTTEPHCISPF